MEYKVSELAEKAGVTKRTIHFYISKGLLLPPKGSGVNSIYDDSHLERLLLIKKLQEQYMPLNKIREYIMENPTDEVGIKKLKKKEVGENHEKREIIEDEEAAKVSLCPENGQENRPLVRRPLVRELQKMMRFKEIF